MKKLVMILAVVGMILIAAGSGTANIIDYKPNYGSGTGIITQGDSFMAPSDFTMPGFNWYGCRVMNGNSNHPNVIFDLYTDNAGSVGTLLYTQTYNYANNPNAYTYTDDTYEYLNPYYPEYGNETVVIDYRLFELTFDTPQNLTDGQTYWVTLTPFANAGDSIWDQPLTYRTSTDGDSSHVYSSTYQVTNGDLAMQIVPEPATLCLLGLGGLLLQRKRV